MSDIIEYFSNHTFADLLLAIGVIIAIYKLIEVVLNAIKKKFEAYHKKRKGEETLEEKIISHDVQIQELKESEIINYEQLNSKLDKITCTIDDLVDNNKKDMQVVLRDKITHIYEKTLKKRYLISHDAKDYHYALERYLANDGNSYVEEEICPQMKQFKVFNSDEDAKKYFETHEE